MNIIATATVATLTAWTIAVYVAWTTALSVPPPRSEGRQK